MERPRDLEALVARAREGDRSAFEAAVGACRGDLEGFVRTRIGQHLRHELELEDVVQETYARALESLSRFRWTGRQSFLRWLQATAEHVILDQARRHRTRASRVLFLDHEPAGDEPSPSRVLRRGERLDRLQQALDGLEPDYREVVCLVRIQGLRIKEAAARMNRSPKSVMHLLARALKRLKDRFGDTESLGLPPGKLEDRGGRDVR